MAQIVNISVLVDSDFDFDTVSIMETIKELHTMDQSLLLDGTKNSEKIIPQLEDAIVNGTYVEGKALTESAVLASKSMAGKDSPDGYAYYSLLDGWVDKAKATKFQPTNTNIDYLIGNPLNAMPDDVICILD